MNATITGSTKPTWNDVATIQDGKLVADGDIIVVKSRYNGVETEVEMPLTVKVEGYQPKRVDSSLSDNGKTLTLSFEKTTHTVTYNDGVDGVEIFADQTTRDIKYGSATPVFNGTPQREGYEFVGWEPAVAETVTSDATYKASWKKINYFTVTYKDGCNGEVFSDVVKSVRENDPTPGFGTSMPNRPGYEFVGWDKDKAPAVTEDAVYTAQWKANDTTSYHIEYYYQENGKYGAPFNTVAKSGTTDQLVSLDLTDMVPEKAGYVVDPNANNVLSGLIRGDESLVLKVYYKQQFSVTYAPGEHAAAGTQSVTTDSLGWNAATPTEARVPGGAGLHLRGLSPERADAVTGDATRGAVVPTTAPYKVEACTASPRASTAPVVNTETGTTDEWATVDTLQVPEAATSSTRTPTTSSPAPSQAAAASCSRSTTSSSSRDLRAGRARRRRHQIVTTDSLGWNAATRPRPEFQAAPGYTFAGWSPERADAVTGDATYVAQWTANDGTAYKVEAYYQSEGQYGAPVVNTETGTTDTEATVDTSKYLKPGYVLDEDADNELTGTISGNGGLVLKVYYKQQFSVTYAPGEHAAAGTQSVTTDSLGWNAATPTEPEFQAAPGYTFAGWSPERADAVTGDATYVAQTAPPTRWRPTTSPRASTARPS